MKADMQPEFLSLEFHTRYFPALLWRGMRPRERQGSGFTSTGVLPVLLVFCLILLISGIPYALAHKSITGWVMGGIGVVGMIFLFINSITSGTGDPPTYNSFLKGIFFFVVTLGASVGIFLGTINHSLLLGLLIGLGGLVAGYLLGILAGLWLQHLGWVASFLNILAGPAILGMLVVDIVLLVGLNG
jgi:hypothetical protein